MPIGVPRSLVEFILLGPEDDRRQLQDSPILGDVWVEFAKNPDKPLELLITPYREQAAGLVASQLAGCEDIQDADIAYLQGIVAARLTFGELLRFVVPMTAWWADKRIAGGLAEYASNPETMRAHLRQVLEAAAGWIAKKSATAMQDLESRKRYIALAGLILWARDHAADEAWAGLSTEQQIQQIVTTTNLAAQLGDELGQVFKTQRLPEKSGLVWTVSLNRRATPALTKSIPAVKADAARTLFTVNCGEILWAVIDSGIDASHPAFCDRKGQSRVLKSFDFTTIREIVSLDNLRNPQKLKDRVAGLLRRGLRSELTEEEAEATLKKLAMALKEGRSIDWELVERLVEIDARKVAPASNHGTHVAGILGASKEASGGAPGVDNTDAADGMCPDISFYDFRVLAPTLRETEFAIIAALQYIRYINERNSFMTIHGANLSLSIPHDVRNYACGRTPVCNECERLVNSGVVVVAAAGNRGYQNFETKEGLYEGYAAFSVTDPGNADGVITVGATHRYWPHTYGVSFFSSRGPTGDGRLKPDLVAPGERIRAPLPGNAWGDLDGTSMAAPHVSGAAAMLMARYSELVGQPRRIKKILCDSATDLGRERSFQGHGMLDVLRAFQSV